MVEGVLLECTKILNHWKWFVRVSISVSKNLTYIIEDVCENIWVVFESILTLSVNGKSVARQPLAA